MQKGLPTFSQVKTPCNKSILLDNFSHSNFVLLYKKKITQIANTTPMANMYSQLRDLGQMKKIPDAAASYCINFHFNWGCLMSCSTWLNDIALCRLLTSFF